MFLGLPWHPCNVLDTAELCDLRQTEQQNKTVKKSTGRQLRGKTVGTHRLVKLGLEM